MPLCKPSPTWGGKAWWRELKRNAIFAIQEHRTGPPLWFGHSYRIIVLQNSLEVAQAPTSALINNDWDEVNAIYDRETSSGRVAADHSQGQQIADMFLAAWTAQNEIPSVNPRVQSLAIPPELIHAVRHADSTRVQKMIEQNEKLLFATDSFDSTLGHIALQHAQFWLLKIFVSKGGDVNLKDKEGLTCLHWSCMARDLQALEYLLKTNSCYLLSIDSRGDTPMHLLARHFLLECADNDLVFRLMKEMISQGANVNAQNFEGDAPLHLAATRGIASLEHFLLLNGAIVHARNGAGLSPLDLAASSSNIAAVQELLESGAEDLSRTLLIPGLADDVMALLRLKNTPISESGTASSPAITHSNTTNPNATASTSAYIQDTFLLRSPNTPTKTDSTNNNTSTSAGVTLRSSPPLSASASSPSSSSPSSATRSSSGSRLNSNAAASSSGGLRSSTYRTLSTVADLMKTTVKMTAEPLLVPAFQLVQVACRTGIDAVNRLQVLSPEELIRIFKLPTDEIFVEQYHCLYHDPHSSIPTAIRLYIFQHFICLHSQPISIYKALQELITFKSVTLLKKVKGTLLSTSIELMVDGGKKYTFSSFFNSTEVYNVLNFLWQNRDRPGPILISGRPLSEMLHSIKYPKENQEMHAIFRGLLPESEALVESHECVCSLENPLEIASKDQFSDMNDITDLDLTASLSVSSSSSAVSPAMAAGLLSSGTIHSSTGQSVSAKGPHKGTLYLCHNFLLFSSSNGWRLSTSFKDVVSVEPLSQASSAAPNTVRVVYDENLSRKEIYLFSFTDPSRAFDTLLRLWNHWRGFMNEIQNVLVYNAGEPLGEQLVRELLEYLWRPAEGHFRMRVRALIRDRNERYRKVGARLATAGADVVYIQDEINSSNDYVFVGVDKLILVSASVDTEHLATDLLQVLEASLKIAEHSLKLIVKVSPIGSTDTQLTSRLLLKHQRVDKAIEFSGVPFALVRVQTPMQVLGDAGAGIKTRGQFGLPLKDSIPIAWIDNRDLVQCLARLVSAKEKSQQTGGAVYTLCGELLTCAEVAAQLSEVTGKAIRFSESYQEATRADMSKSGRSMAELDLLWEFLQKISADEARVRTYSDLDELLGRKRNSVKRYVEDHISQFDLEYRQYFAEDELLRLLEQYNHFSPSKDGLVERKSFADALGPLLRDPILSDALFEAFDFNHEGHLTFRKFATGLSFLTRASLPEQLEFAFKLYDRNHDGRISENEISSLAGAVSNVLKQLKLDNVSEVKPLLMEVFSPDSTRIEVHKDEFKQNALKNLALIQSLGLRAAISAQETEADAPALSLAHLPICFGHPKWPLVMALTIGIRKAVGEISTLPDRELVAPDLTASNSFELPGLDAHHACTFTDYAPLVFRKIRELFGVNCKSYMYSLGPERLLGNLLLGHLSTLEEVVTSARSGSFFLRSPDGAYMLKTLPSAEEEQLRKVLGEYYEHLQRNPHSLLSRVYGLHSLRYAGRSVTFLVMANLFSPSPALTVHEQYDLKGSTIDRLIDVDDSQGLADIALKDMNLHRRIYLGPARKARLLEQVERDCKWLESHNVCDYSLLVGFHFSKKLTSSAPEAHSLTRSLPKDASRKLTLTLSNRKLSSMPGSDRSQFRSDSGGMLSASGEEIYFIGIIDHLTEYNLKKKSEHRLKSLVHDSTRISAIPPAPYRRRFQLYLSTIIE